MGGTEEQLEQLTDSELSQQFLANESTEHLIAVAREQKILTSLVKGLVLREERKRCEATVDMDGDAWRLQRWGDQVENIFLEMRPSLERVNFWTLRDAQKGLAMEHYYKLTNGETSLIKLSKSNGSVEHHTNIAPTSLAQPIRKTLKRARQGIPQKPLELDGSYLIIQLEAWIAPALDDDTRKKLLRKLEQRWATREIARRLGSEV